MKTFIALFLLLPLAVLAQPATARDYFQQIVELWKFEKYWDGTDPLPHAVTSPKPVPVAIFWTPMNGTASSVGLCAHEFDRCLLYSNWPPRITNITEPFGTEPDPLKRAHDFIQSHGREPQRLTDMFSGVKNPPLPAYQVELLTVPLPALGPPLSIQRQSRLPAASLRQLIQAMSCPDPKAHGLILVPFYSPPDPYLYVYRRCGAEEAILVPHNGGWGWALGALDQTTDPTRVSAIKSRISVALQAYQQF